MPIFSLISGSFEKKNHLLCVAPAPQRSICNIYCAGYRLSGVLCPDGDRMMGDGNTEFRKTHPKSAKLLQEKICEKQCFSSTHLLAEGCG